MPKISELVYVSSPTTADSLPIVDGGVTKKTTLNDLPISAATQVALNLKAPLASPTFTGTVSGITQAMIGLSKVDNTSDVNKPVSTAQQTAISAVTSFRNKVRNSKMDFAQRGTSFAAITSGSYGLDGWRVFRSGAHVVTMSQQANGNTSSECQSVLRIAVTTANAAPGAGDYLLVSQPIEGYLVRDLVGNPIAIRFEVKSPKTGTHCVALRNLGAGSVTDRSYVLTYNVVAANTAQVVTLAIPGGLITAGTWNFTTGLGVSLDFCLLSGATYQTTAGAWQTGNFFATSGQVNCMDSTANVFEITGVQLEKATSSTSFEHRDMATELNFNQRYFQTMNVNTYASGFIQDYTLTAMRALPSISIQSSNWTGSPNFGGTGSNTFRQTSYVTTGGSGILNLSAELS